MSPPIGKHAVVPPIHEPYVPTANRPQPHPHKKKYLPGDWDGLRGLASDLYGYVMAQESSGTIPNLVGWVKELVESDPDLGGFDGKWIGETAYQFTKAFTVDATLINGLNKVICKSAMIIDHLGCDLTNNQAKLEAELLKRGKRHDPKFTLDWLEHKSNALMWHTPKNLYHGAPPYNPMSLSLEATGMLHQFAANADNLRARAGAELTGIANLLFDAASFYTKQSEINSKAPETLLNPTQSQDLTRDFDSIKKDLKNYSKEHSADSGDVDAVKQVLKGLGAKGKELENLIADIKSVKKAEGWLDVAEAAGKAVSYIPALAVVGGFLR